MKKCALVFLLLLTAPTLGIYQPSTPNLEARKWFDSARFGLFIHWGVYSQLAHGEWVMNNQKISQENYEQLPELFNPIKFDAAQWVALAKAAGMRYITITSKHHDGFAMFGTKQNNWNIVERTPYGKDILKQLADECHKQDIKLFFYYSQLDWRHPDYYPRGNTGNHNQRSNSGDWNNYIKFMNAQLEELLTNYGTIAGIWFDGWWDKPWANWDLPTTFNLIHRLQPHALIGSNHHFSPFDGQDFQMFEQDLPGQNTAGFESEGYIYNENNISSLPLETCLTITQRAWGVDLVDVKNTFRTTKELIAYLAGSASRNANLLLNIGPLSDGTFPQEAVKSLQEIGAWMSKNGESIYNTKGGPVSPRAWGVTTQNGNKIYIHLFNWDKQDLLWLPINSVNKIYYLVNKEQIAYQRSNDGVLLKNIILVDPYDTVLVVEIDKK